MGDSICQDNYAMQLLDPGSIKIVGEMKKKYFWGREDAYRGNGTGTIMGTETVSELLVAVRSIQETIR